MRNNAKVCEGVSAASSPVGVATSVPNIRLSLIQMNSFRDVIFF